MSVILAAIENVSSSGSASFPGTYTGHVITPYDRPFSVSAAGGTITVTYNVDFSVFPLQYVDYITPAGNLTRIQGIDAIENLPSPIQSPEIIKMREDTKSVVDFILTVFSIGTETDEEGNSSTTEFSTSYSIIITANYDTNRDRLIAEVNARR
jgi:hypothetical protein